MLLDNTLCSPFSLTLAASTHHQAEMAWSEASSSEDASYELVRATGPETVSKQLKIPKTGAAIHVICKNRAFNVTLSSRRTVRLWRKFLHRTAKIEQLHTSHSGPGRDRFALWIDFRIGQVWISRGKCAAARTTNPKSIHIKSRLITNRITYFSKRNYYVRCKNVLAEECGRKTIISSEFCRFFNFSCAKRRHDDFRRLRHCYARCACATRTTPFTASNYLIIPYSATRCNKNRSRIAHK